MDKLKLSRIVSGLTLVWVLVSFAAYLVQFQSHIQAVLKLIGVV